MATTRPTKRPASEACQAGRRKAPSIASTVTIGNAATTTDGSTAPATGVSDWGNTGLNEGAAAVYDGNGTGRI